METIHGYGRPGEVIRNFHSLAACSFLGAEGARCEQRHDNCPKCVLHNFRQNFHQCSLIGVICLEVL
jgi:hypothetical protein